MVGYFAMWRGAQDAPVTGVTPPVGAPAILMESTGYPLLEDGSHILLE